LQRVDVQLHTFINELCDSLQRHLHSWSADRRRMRLEKSDDNIFPVNLFRQLSYPAGEQYNQQRQQSMMSSPGSEQRPRYLMII
jgi:hypothetical protein